MENTAKVTTVLAIFATQLADNEIFQAFSKDKKIRALRVVSALLEEYYDLLEDEELHEEFEIRFYNSIVVPWCDLDPREESKNDAS